jgi:thymidylate kinase/thymidylate synthase ThyX
MTRGKLIILEGPTGSGKSTQSKILFQKLKAANLPVKMFEFPDIANSLISRSINRMIDNPDYDLTEATKVLLDSINSSQTMKTISQSLKDGVYCICEGSYMSAIVKYCYLNGSDNYQDVITIMSFANMGIAADLTIVFDAPPKLLIDRKINNNKVGIDIDELEKIRTGYLIEARNNRLPIIFTTDPVDIVSELVWEYTAKCLAIRNPLKINTDISAPTSVSEILDYKTELLSTDLSKRETEELLIVKNGKKVITESGKKYLETIITNVEDEVYAFRDNISAVTVATALARLNRHGDDLRTTLLDESTQNAEANQKLLKRVIHEYGNDSLQQLSGFQVVVEGASNLLSKHIEQGRLVSYSGQLTKNIYDDQKDSKGNYNFFIPKELDSATKKEYRKIINQIYDNYSDIVEKLIEYIKKINETPIKRRDSTWRDAIKTQARDIARLVLPVSAKSTVGIYGSGQAIEAVVMRLMSSDLTEAKVTGKKILDNIRKVAPIFYERTDDPMLGEANIAYRIDTENVLRKIASKKIKSNFSSDLEAIKLIDFYPKNEIDLVPYMLYNQTDLSMSELKYEIDGWSYKDKSEIFENYFGTRLNRRDKPGRALEVARYTWDIVCDSDSFRDLQRHHMVDNLVWQDLTPRFGYETPELIEKANLLDKFDECFNLSLKLFSLMKLKKYDKQSQYATLLGHKMRFQVTINARETLHILELNSMDQRYSNSSKIVLEMYQKLSEIHPLMAKAMNSINVEKNPKMMRLASERSKNLK